MKKRVLLSLLFSVVLLATAVSPVLAAPGNDPPSPPPGQAQAGIAGAQCGTGAASGAFGYYAHGYIPQTYDTPRAANGAQTGLNNSGVCGNRQGNLP
jgi:hypothetical protein